MKTKILFILVLAIVLPMSVMASGSSENEKKELRFGLNDPAGTNNHNAVLAFKEYVEANLDVTVIVYPGGQLGDYRAMAEQVMDGELDFEQLGYPDMSYLIPELKIIGEPYVITSYDHLLRVIDGPYGQDIDKKMQALGVRVLSVGYYGTRNTTSNVPVNTIDDLKGLKLRVPNVDFLIDYAEAVGAIPAPVAFAEVYLALQTNQVDAQENPLPTIDAMKFYEVQKYIAMTQHFIASQAIIINEKLWSSASDKEQAVFKKAAEIAAETLTKATEQQESELLDTFKSRGLTITYPDIAPFQEAMKPYYKKLNDKFGENSIENLIDQ